MKKAMAIICVGNVSYDPKQQVILLPFPKEFVSGADKKEHTFYLADIEDESEHLTIKVYKKSKLTATEHYENCRRDDNSLRKIKIGKAKVDLNRLSFGDLLNMPIWGFEEMDIDDRVMRYIYKKRKPKITQPFKIERKSVHNKKGKKS